MPKTSGRLVERLLRAGWLRTAIIVAAVAVALVVTADVVTSSPALCGSCHEMQVRTSGWQQSAHVEVKCVKCHVAPHAWYQYPQALIGRAALLRRDVVRHAVGGYDDPVDSRLAGAAPMSDKVCLQCHDPNRKATSGFRIKIEHAKHAKRNKSCVSCHVRTAHPAPTRGRALSLMAQCYTCHGTSAYPAASTKCTVCHPSDFKLRPASHGERKWKREHGRVAVEDRKQCVLCHTKSFCTRCHGIPMPHPADWERGKNGHSLVAKTKRAVCVKCHEGKPNLCTMCHHRGYDPSKGTWKNQHFLRVREEGAAFCLECHSPVFCADCHVRGTSSPSQAGG